MVHSRPHHETAGKKTAEQHQLRMSNEFEHETHRNVQKTR